MEWLNYHHLHCFWLVAREGRLTAAAEKLRLAPSTVSAQVRQLEDQLGVELFVRRGRGMELTEAGRAALESADQIFGLGQELQAGLRDVGSAAAVLRLRIGVADVLPKLLSARLVQPALLLSRPVHLLCRQGRPDRLLAELGLHELDLVLTDAPTGIGRGLRLHTHPLLRSPLALYGAPALVTALAPGFPASLEGAPLLLSAEGGGRRRAVEAWLGDRQLRPIVVAECEDSAMLKSFGQAGLGCIAMPTAVEAELAERHNLRPIGLLEGVEDKVFAVTTSRRPTHPGLRAILGLGPLDPPRAPAPR
ncbi:MAG: LysR family transcriptional regulator [Deltaproteobacteria bacterium]|nr:LysR family transcriptional regulator [Deltaproteobacteria bacterium]